MNSYEQKLIEDGYVEVGTLKQHQKFLDISGNQWVRVDRGHQRGVVHCVNADLPGQASCFGSRALVLPLSTKEEVTS